jgi:hypothetical protein
MLIIQKSKLFNEYIMLMKIPLVKKIINKDTNKDLLRNIFIIYYIR